MTREERRKAMPLCAEFIDDFRKHFGELKSIKATENGHTIEWHKSKPADDEYLLATQA